MDFLLYLFSFVQCNNDLNSIINCIRIIKIKIILKMEKKKLDIFVYLDKV